MLSELKIRPLFLLYHPLLFSFLFFFLNCDVLAYNYDSYVIICVTMARPFYIKEIESVYLL